jgi:hypothetical protein
LAKLEDEIASFCISIAMLLHSIFRLDSVALQDCFLKIGTVEEGEKFETNHTVQLLQREAIEISMELRESFNSLRLRSSESEQLY